MSDDRLVLCNEAFRRLYPNSADRMIPGTRYEDILRGAAYENRTSRARTRKNGWPSACASIASSWNPSSCSSRTVAGCSSPSAAPAAAALPACASTSRRSSAFSNRCARASSGFDRTQRIAHIGTVERDLAHQRVVWSDETYRIFGVSPESYTPSVENLLGFVHPEDRGRCCDVLRLHRQEQARIEPQIPHHAAQTARSVRLLPGRYAYNDAGQPLYISIAMMDITEKEQANQRQLELETQLRHSEKLTALGTLAGGIAHDLNNTLVPIQALSKLAMRELPADAHRRATISRPSTRRAFRRATSCVRSSPSAASRKCSTSRRISRRGCGKRCRSCARAYRARSRSSTAFAPIHRFLADGTQLQQVVVNLVTNGAYAIGDNCGRVMVALDEVPGPSDVPRRIQPQRRRHRLRHEPRDHASHVRAVLHHQSGRRRHRPRSFGGAWHRDQPGGQIDVKSTPGEGTEFIVVLPVKSVDEDTRTVAAVA